MKCRICNSKVKFQRLKIRNGEKKNLYKCLNCGFAFFNKDYSNFILNNKFEEQRLNSAGLDIPNIKIDFDNGYKQAVQYRKEFIKISDLGKNILEIGCSWGECLEILGRKIWPGRLSCNRH